MLDAVAPVVGFEDTYRVSDRGRVWSSLRGGRYLRPGRMSAGGHVSVMLGRKGGSHCVHKLVLTAFVGPAPKGMEARHLNGVPDDNRWPENLKWDTRSNNAQDKKWHNGQRSYKLSAEQAHEAKNLILNGAHWQDVATAFDISRSAVYAIKAGKYHRDV